MTAIPAADQIRRDVAAHIGPIPSTVTTNSPLPTVSVPPSESPVISFVTVTFGTGMVVVRMIETLVASLPRDLAYEVVVVDNPHPTGGTLCLQRLRLFTAGVRVVRPDRNLGFGGGTELGIHVSNSPRLGLVNPDLEFTAGWFEPLNQQLDNSARPTVVSPVFRRPDGTVQERGAMILDDLRTAPLVGEPPTETDHSIVDYASAACWLVDRSTHELVGGFDPLYHPAYYEDPDYALRLELAGGECMVVHDSSVVHRTGTGSKRTAPMSNHEQLAHFRNRWAHYAPRQPSADAVADRFGNPRSTLADDASLDWD